MLWPLNSREVLQIFLEQYKACTCRLWCRHTITIRPAHAQRFANFTKYFDKFQHVQICRDL